MPNPKIKSTISGSRHTTAFLPARFCVCNVYVFFNHTPQRFPVCFIKKRKRLENVLCKLILPGHYPVNKCAVFSFIAGRNTALRRILNVLIYPAVVADWKIELGNLVVLRVIRIEIVLPVKFAVLVDAAVGGKTHGQCIFHNLLIQNRKRTRHTGADRAGVGIRRSAKLRGAAAENFGFGGQFYVNRW